MVLWNWNITLTFSVWMIFGCAQGEREQDENPSAIVTRLQQIKAERTLAT